MKKGLLLLIMIPLLLQGYSQDYFSHKENQNKNHLLIMHPTRSNLDRYTYLLDRKILDPGNNQVVWVYYENENYDYTAIIKEFPQYGYQMIPAAELENQPYGKNELSDDFKKLFDYSKGVIFNGGPDIPPSSYGEPTLTLTRISDPQRNLFELSFLFHLTGGEQDSVFTAFLKSRPRYMVFGICLGMQSMNVAAGGTLIQDIPQEVYAMNTIEDIAQSNPDNLHRNYYSDLHQYPEIKSYILHPVKILKGRWLDRKVKSDQQSPFVFSSHHQAIGNLASSYRISATSTDGAIIEGIEHMKYPNVTGVQFHPEHQSLYQEELLSKSEPDDELFSVKEKLKDLNSYNFHLELWKSISKTIK